MALGSASKRFASAVSAICGGDGLHLIKPLALKDVLDARLLDRVQANTLQQRRILKTSITHTADQLQRRMSEHAVATALQRRPSAEQLRERAVLTERSERAATLRRQLTAAELSRQPQARPTPDQLEERNILRQHLRSVSARLALRIEALKAGWRATPSRASCGSAPGECALAIARSCRVGAKPAAFSGRAAPVAGFGAAIICVCCRAFGYSARLREVLEDLRRELLLARRVVELDQRAVLADQRGGAARASPSGFAESYAFATARSVSQRAGTRNPPSWQTPCSSRRGR